jgi:hypothetical protein
MAVPPGLTETDAEVVPPVLQMAASAEPGAIDDDLVSTAACRELTDRIHADCWAPDLVEVLAPGVPCPP